MSKPFSESDQKVFYYRENEKLLSEPNWLETIR